MTREEFCNMMSEAKAVSGVSTSELSFGLKMLLSALRRFEQGKHNFNMPMVIRYLDVLNSKLVLIDKDRMYPILSYDDLLETYIEIRKAHGFSQIKLAPIVGLSKCGMSNIEAKVSKLTIDTLLRMCEYCKVEIKIIRKEAAD